MNIESIIKCLLIINRLNQIDTKISELKEFVLTANFRSEQDALLRIADFVNLTAEPLEGKDYLNKKTSFPVLVKKENADVYFVIIKQLDDKFLIHEPGQDSPRWLSKQDLQAMSLVQAYQVAPVVVAGGKALSGQGNWVLRKIAKFKKLFLDIFLASLFIQVLSLSGPIFFQTIIDKVIQHQSLSTLDVLAIGFLIAIIFEVMLSSLRNILSSKASANIDLSLGKNYFSHLIRLPKVYFDKTTTGKQVSNVKDLERLRNLITDSSITLYVDIIFSVLFLCVMFYYSKTLALIVSAFIPCYAVLAVIFSKLLQPKIEEKHKQSEKVEEFLIDSFSGVESMKTLCAEEHFDKQWSQHLSRQVETNYQLGKVENIYKQISLSLNKLSGLCVLYFGAGLVVENEITMGQFIAFNLLTQRLLAPIERVSRSMSTMGEIKALINKISTLSNLESENQTTQSDIKSGKPLSGNIRFEKAGFGYSRDKTVFKDLDFSFNANKSIGIFAAKGSGKSTLIKLILGLYPLSSGNLYLNNININSVNTSWYRRQISLVSQTPYLFNLTVMDNIAIRNKLASFSDIVKVATLVGIDGFINSLPEGYHTNLQEHGIDLSVEQAQAISIARALLLDAKVLIFDDVFVCADKSALKYILANLKKFSVAKTLIFTSSELKNLAGMDELFEIKHQQVVPLQLLTKKSSRPIKATAVKNTKSTAEVQP